MQQETDAPQVVGVVLQGHPDDNSMDCMPLAQQEFSQVRSILASNAYK
jgi:hypothetical protein